MEDLLILIFQVLFEVLMSLPWDWTTYRRRETLGEAERAGNVAMGLMSFLGGAAVGGVSLLFLPDLLARWVWLRMAWLLVAPLISGTLAYWLARRRVKVGRRANPREHFWWSFMFTLGLVAMRFAFGVRVAG